MSDNLGSGALQSAPQSAADNVSTAPTAYDEIAATISKAISGVTGLVPAFERRHTETVQFVNRFKSFSPESIRSTIAAIEANPELNSANKFDVQESRATLQFLDAFRPVIDQVEEFLTNLKFTYGARKARAIADVLQTLQIGKGIGRDPSSAGVEAHTKLIQRDLRRPRVKPVKAVPPGAATEVK